MKLTRNYEPTTGYSKTISHKKYAESELYARKINPG